MSILVDLTGKRFGKLVVVDRRKDASGVIKWHCNCDCGGTRLTTSNALRNGLTVSCGCYLAEMRRAKAKARPHSLRESYPTEYLAWCHMRGRCNNTRSADYKNYGGRGIRVSPDWEKSFEAFLAHVGPRPMPDYTLDRINNDGNYEPGNVRWANRATQRSNQRPYKYKNGPFFHTGIQIERTRAKSEAWNPLTRLEGKRITGGTYKTYAEAKRKAYEMAVVRRAALSLFV